MKNILLVYILLNFLSLTIEAYQLPINLLFGQDYSKSISDSTKDSTNLEDVNRSIRFYTNTHLLVGAEIPDPVNPKEFFSRATQLWKTDTRLGITVNIEKDIKSFFSLRGNDSPETNSIKLYEIGANIKREWGSIWFGQIRKQMGNGSYYLNQAFDRRYWDEGLIYGFLVRGIGADFVPGKFQVNIFLGSEISASFLSGIDIVTNPFSGFNAGASALYIARDPQYAGFGVQSGIELEESYNSFWGYQVFSFKSFDQQPNPIKELTLFTEGRLIQSHHEIGTAFYFKKIILNDKNNDEIRMGMDYMYKVSKDISLDLQMEFFRVLGFDEIQIGLCSFFTYANVTVLIPRIRYIITEFGPDILFVGIESKIIF